MITSIPRSEHPRPQFVRRDWLNLNGVWTITFDPGKSGQERNFEKSTGFEIPINVPFCPESKLSGVQHTDFIDQLWYHRKVTVPAEWTGKRIIIHFGGVYYKSTVFINGAVAGKHTGGVTPFDIEIPAAIAPGETFDLVLRVENDLRSGNQPFGKQSPWFESAECSYSRTTGIWQTVWLEAVANNGLKQCRIIPDTDSGTFIFIPQYYAVCGDNQLRITVSDGTTAASTVHRCVNGIPLTVALESPRLWEPGNPFLYDVKYELLAADGAVIEEITSYAGLRKIHIEKNRIYLNNHPVFLRFVLDQGFYEESIWTAPSDAALKGDIELSMKSGFNGARLHQKVFDERYHYWADHLGYLTWGEFPDWGLAFWEHFPTSGSPDYNLGYRDFTMEWTTIVERDFNHPSIITWTPYNETRLYRNLEDHRRFVEDTARLTRQLDPTRPVHDTSGYTHTSEAELWSVHRYSQDSETLVKALRPENAVIDAAFPDVELEYYRQQPYLVDEYGGIRFIPADRKQYAERFWSYGETPDTPEKAVAKISSLTHTLVSMDEVSGYCYTQLTDVEQEQNGLFNYDRSSKFDQQELYRIFSEKPDWSKY